MAIYRYAKLPLRPNDPTRRYRIVRIDEHVGDIEIEWDAPDGASVLLSVVCLPVLSATEREDSLASAEQFTDELVTGWGLQVTEPQKEEWLEQPDGTVRMRLEYRVV